MKDYYEILEVSRNASQEVIDKVYKILAKRYHPDLNLSNVGYCTAKMKEINEAYCILKDTNKRKEYDKTFNKNDLQYFKSNEVNYEGLDVVEYKVVKYIIVGIVICIVLIGTSMFLNMYKYDEDAIKILSSTSNKFVYLSNYQEARSEGKWKNGINKIRTGYILNKPYQNNLVGSIKILGFKSYVNNKDYIENSYCSSDYLINGKYSKLAGFIGVDDKTKNSMLNGIIEIYGDGRKLYTSEKLYGGFSPKVISIDINKVNRLSIRITAYAPEISSFFFSDKINVGVYSGIIIE